MSNEAGVKIWLTQLVSLVQHVSAHNLTNQQRQYGFSYVENCPIDSEASKELLQRIAFVRNTHYGKTQLAVLANTCLVHDLGGFYDFTADLSSGDTAYTQLGIGAHTDNTYFTDPAGLQMFHLLSHTDGTGGKSQLIDGFAAANELLEQDPEAYRMLATTTVHSHASGGKDISIQPQQAYPVLCHDPQNNSLIQIRWNTTDRAAIDLPIEEMDRWYDAARKWTTILRKREYWDQLQPGRPLIFDNWRILHGRSAFRGNRRMCGGYINRDDWISRFRLLDQGRDYVLEGVARG